MNEPVDLGKCCLDPECISLVRALNTVPGIRTTCSCCGHGNATFRIWLVSETVEALLTVGQAACRDWMVRFAPGCDTLWLVESYECGQAAYDAAERFAARLEGRADG